MASSTTHKNSQYSAKASSPQAKAAYRRATLALSMGLLSTLTFSGLMVSIFAFSNKPTPQTRSYAASTLKTGAAPIYIKPSIDAPIRREIIGKIPPPSNQTSIIPTSINDAGMIVGYSGGTYRKAFLWNGKVSIELGTLGGPTSAAYNLNNNGLVVGQSRLLSAPLDQAFRYQNGVMTLLSPESNLSQADGINDSGVAVGYLRVNSDYKGVLWDTTGKAEILGTLGGNMSWVTSINNLGNVTGVSSLSANNVNQKAFYKSASSKTLVNLQIPGGDSRGIAINDNNQIVGNVSTNNGQRGFMWLNSKSSILEPLTGHAASSVNDLNNKGLIVGVSNSCYELNNPKCSDAIIWNPNPISLDAYLVANKINGWHLITAKSINNNNQIVGQAVDPTGATVAYILTYM